MANTFTGIILQCMPEIGQALVMRIGGTAGGRDVYVATLPYEDSITGAAVYNAFPEGTCVDCATVENGSLVKCKIVGVSKYWKDRTRAQGTRNVTAAAGLPGIGAKLAKAFIGNKTGVLAKHGAGAPRDILPGDLLIKEKTTGVGQSVRRQEVALEGPQIAKIRAGVDDRVAISGMRVSLDTPMSECVDEGDLAVENYAYTLGEAFGVLHMRPPIKISDSNDASSALSLTMPDAIPLYRIQRMRGEWIGGDDLVIFGVPENAVQHDSTHEPDVLARMHAGIAGDINGASSERVCFVKTPDIPAMTQLGYREKSAVPGSNGKFEDLREPFQDDNSDSVPIPGIMKPDNDSDSGVKTLDELFDELTEDERVRDAVLYLLARRVLNKGYAGKVAHKGLGWHASTQEDSDAEAKTLEPTDNPELPLPRLIPVQDAPRTADRHYDSTSFITQEPDGSICLCDGYGSEIRMSRGNIYISPALDLYLRPGRDLSAMVGRHQAYNSQGSLTLNTSDAMFVRSGHRMEFCSGTADKPNGVEGIIMESRSVVGDVVIKSAHDMSATGAANVLLGRRQVLSSTGGTQTAYGILSIDAGNSGVTYVHGGRALSVEASRVDILALYDNDRGTAIRLGGSVIDILAQTVRMPAQVLMVAPPEGVRMKVPRDGGTTEVGISTAAQGKESLVVGNQLITYGSARIHGSALVCGKAIANGMVSTSRYNMTLSDKVLDPDKDNYAFKIIDLPDVSSLNDRAFAAAESIALLQSDGILSSSYAEAHEFRFPRSYGIKDSIIYPGMLWQQHTDGIFWEEASVPSASGDASMCYPGITVWENAGISKVDTGNGVKSAPLNMTGYRIMANKLRV